MKQARFSMVGVVMIVLLLLAQPAAAEIPPAAGIDTAAIDAAVERQMAKHGLPGVALAVTKDNQVAYLRGYGLAGPGRPMTPQTPMYLGSQSKSFTGLAVAQLVSAGKLTLNAPVQRYIPWFALADPQAAKTITINHLLHHTSGLSDAGWTTILADDTTLEEAVRALSSAQLTAPVGKQHQYFNLNYTVLMLVVETVSGQPFADYVQAHILDPLKMSRSYTDPAIASENGLAQGYSRLFGFAVPVRQPHRAFQLGTGYLISSAEDMAHYTIALNNQGVYQGSSILPGGRVQMLFSPVQGYGMGWYVSPERYSHGGANEAFRTEVILYPKQKLGLVLLVNEGAMIDHYLMSTQLLGAVEAALLGDPEPAYVTGGWSMRALGLGLLAALLALSALHAWNFWNLRTWAGRARRMPPSRVAFEVAISFIIPTLILLLIYTQVRGFLGPRFNLTYQLITMFRTMPEPSILIVLGSLPDYIQGVLKVAWIIQGKTRTVLTPAPEG